MSIFSQLAAANGSSMKTAFADTITYIPLGGANLTLSAMVLESPPEMSGATRRGQINKTLIRIFKSDYPTKPTVGGDMILTADMSRPATVQKIENENDPLAWNLTVE